MLRVAVCLLFGILGVSAIIVEPIFTFKTLSSIFRQNHDDCKVCYRNHDCLTMDKARCEYYMEVGEVLQKTVDDQDEDEEIPELKESIDDLLFDIVEKASVASKECIPYLSEYTDCTKENICTGCKRCSCDAQGGWNCSTVQKCRPDDILNVDHKVLVTVMEKLINNDISNRIKRAIKETPQNTSKITYKEIIEWLYDVKPLKYDSFDINVNDDAKNSSVVHTVNTTPSVSNQADIDYLAFDEVLNNIAVDPKNYSRRKPPLDAEHNETENFDYMNMEDINITINKANVSDQFMNMLNEIEGMEPVTTITEAPIEGITKVFIDLLQSGKNTFNFNESDYMNLDNKINSELKLFDNTNYIDEFNIVNIMKREISNASNITELNSTERIVSVTNSTVDLKDNVLQPLTDIISEKEKELQELLRVKENLMSFMKYLNSGDIDLNFKDNKTENNSNTYFSIYKMEIIPQFDYDLRKKNPQVLDKHLYKLKRDIYEVIRDIVGIKKLAGKGNIPKELKVLIRAMKYYIRNDNNMNTELKNQNTRKQYNIDIFTPYPQTIKDCVIEIFELLDKDMPETNALSPISQTAKKLLKRIINNNYVDQSIGKIHDSNYNLTNNLSNIGNNWQEMTLKVINSALHERLYTMKLLYLILSVDIIKLTEALTLTNLANTRRTIDPRLGEKLFKNIHIGLQNINNKITTIMHKHNKTKQLIIGKKKANGQKVVFKESFLKRLRKLFKNSKNDIKNLLKSKVPKSEIVKVIAKKRLSDMTKRKLSEYEDVMKRWQYNLDLIPKRYKRSPKDRNRMKNRIKNIIPKYLRGKISPAIVAKDSKKVTKKDTKKEKSKHYNKAVPATTMKSEITSNKHNNKTKVQ